ncbi:MAG: DUF4432 family protein [Lachnospiraceae bacterium]|nr:DUF4432 family protein [Lachnospiraceae bacterium]
MARNKYIGHDSQIYGVEEHRLVGGKGDGMRLFQVKNGKGLEFTVSADRGADISRLSFKGINMGYFSPTGYVAPAYYDDKDAGFLKSFTAGFLTTCGLRAVGNPCEDEGEQFPLHGSIGNQPAEHIYWVEEEDSLHIKAVVPEEAFFGDKLTMHRHICCSLKENKITITDKITNCGDKTVPALILYHMNMGYPLLSEKAQLYIPSVDVAPRTEEAAKGIDHWQEIPAPQACYEEQCFYHKFAGEGKAGIFNPEVNAGLMIRYDAKNLPFFTQWKMMGEREYVMGLEPGNSHPDGRAQMREEGNLTFLKPDEAVQYQVAIELIDGIERWKKYTSQ